MANSINTPLQLTVIASMLQNQGLNQLPTALQQAIATYNATTVVSNWLAAVNFYKAQSFFTETTFDLLLSIGSTICPALGNSIPASPVGNYPNLIKEYLTYNTVTDTSTIDPSGFSWLIDQTGNAYLGDGDYGRFAQGFMAIQGYINTVNDCINTSVNANEYLGPTFTTMDSLVTDSIADVNTNFSGFATDISKQGQLVNLQNIELYGTPAALLQQLSSVAKIQGASIPDVQDTLLAYGLTKTNVSDLVNNNQYSLFNPNGLTANEFDTLQKIAYSAMTTVTGDTLTQILDILDVTTPNITVMSDLLDPLVMFPNSYSTMYVPSDNGPVPIFNSNGSVNSNVAPIVSVYLPTSTGCDELGKIIPPAAAVANKAIQVGLQQIGGITNTQWPTLAETIQGIAPEPWNIQDEYLANSLVQNGEPIPVNYLAMQDVPAGVNLTDTDYWQPTTIGGLNTMSGLPLIEAQTTAVDSSITDYIANTVATGSGPNGVITTYDVLGTAIDANDFASRLSSATTAINALQTTVTAGSFVVGQNYTILVVGTTDFTLIGAASNTPGVSFTATGVGTGTGTASQLGALNNAYVAILAAGNDAGVLTQITNANAAIAALSASPYVTTLNTAWTYIAGYLNTEKGYQIEAGVDYFNLLAGEKGSIYSFGQNLTQYAEQTAAGNACEFLQNIADTTVLGGQAIVGAMREARNTPILANASLLTTANQIPVDPPVAPIPAVTPVN